MKPVPFDILSSDIRSGVALIDSSAGTGKTYTIASVYPRILLEGVAEDVSRILVVTFTNAAADELAARIRLRLRECLHAFDPLSRENEIAESGQPDPFMEYVRKFGENGKRILSRAVISMDQAAIYTIHGFCRKALQEAAFESLMPLECQFSENDQDLLQQTALDFWRQHIINSEFLLAVLQQHKITRDTLLSQYRHYSNKGDCTLLPDAPDLSQSIKQCTQTAQLLKENLSEARLLALYQSLPPLSTAKTNQPALLLQNPQQLAQVTTQAILDNDLPLPDQVAPVTSAFLKTAIKAAKERDAFDPPQLVQFADQYLAALDGCMHSLRAAFFTFMDANLRKASEENHTLSFDDLLVRLREALLDAQAGERLQQSLRHQFQAAMIDEFQDTDPVQLDIFSRIFSKARPVYYIGDPKQAIYSFRGADIFAYLSASRDAERHFTLGKNWRSEAGMVQSVNALFSLSENPFLFDGIRFDPSDASDKADKTPLKGDNGKHLQWVELPQPEDGKPLSKDAATEHAATLTADYIAAGLSGSLQIGERDVMPSDFAVLVRTNNQAVAIKASLQQKNIPAVVGGGGNIFDSEQFAQIELLLSFILGNPASASLCGDFFALSAAQVAQLNNDPQEKAVIAREVATYKKIWLSGGINSMLLEIMRNRNVAERILLQNDGQRAMTNYRHLMEILCQGPENPHALLRWLQLRKQQPASQEDELRLESDSDAVQIVTIHKSKGLEYGIVLCPFLWYSRAAKKDVPAIAHVEQGKLVYDCGSELYEEHFQQMQKESLSEDLRVLYVALTRPVHRCVIVWGDVKSAQYSALGTLLNHCDGVDGVIKKYPQLMEKVLVQKASPVAPPPAQQRNLFDVSHRVFPSERELKKWSASSFSSITRGNSPASTAAKSPQPLHGLHGFGKGKGAPPANVTGTCLHEILELHDFNTVNMEQIDKTLKRFGLDSPGVHQGTDHPSKCVSAMLQTISDTSLNDGESTITLSHSDCRISEMPFTLPVLQLEMPQDILDIFAGHPYSDYAKSLTAQQAQGFLTGIIDLVFRVGEKWYIADWKSNFLGPDQTSYDPLSLQHSICEHHYTLQYYLYTVALNRYLRIRDRSYNYLENFGGVFYIYLRGVDGNGHGIHFERPEPGRIELMEKLFFREPSTASGV